MEYRKCLERVRREYQDASAIIYQEYDDRKNEIYAHASDKIAECRSKYRGKFAEDLREVACIAAIGSWELAMHQANYAMLMTGISELQILLLIEEERCSDRFHCWDG
jgi:hypothetical protein